MDVVFREANFSDLDSVLGVWHQLSPPKENEPCSRNELERRMKEILSDKNHYLFVLESGKKIVALGMLLMQLNLSHGTKSTAHIENIVVDEPFRGKGFGRKMVERLVEKAREMGCYKAVLYTDKKTAPFYNRLDFKESSVGMRLDF